MENSSQDKHGIRNNNIKNSLPCLNVNSISLVSSGTCALGKKEYVVHDTKNKEKNGSSFSMKKSTNNSQSKLLKNRVVFRFKSLSKVQPANLHCLSRSKITDDCNDNSKQVKTNFPIWKKKKNSSNISFRKFFGQSRHKSNSNCVNSNRIVSPPQRKRFEKSPINNYDKDKKISSIKTGQSDQQLDVQKRFFQKKIYYSEKQSRKICGVPAVPPSSPENDFNDNHVIKIPSLSDNKARNEIKKRLLKLEQKQADKEKNEKQKLLEEEKLLRESQELQRRHIQRQKIYAINKIMSEKENEQFVEFMSQREGAPV